MVIGFGEIRLQIEESQLQHGDGISHFRRLLQPVSCLFQIFFQMDAVGIDEPDLSQGLGISFLCQGAEISEEDREFLIAYLFVGSIEIKPRKRTSQIHAFHARIAHELLIHRARQAFFINRHGHGRRDALFLRVRRILPDPIVHGKAFHELSRAEKLVGLFQSICHWSHLDWISFLSIILSYGNKVHSYQYRIRLHRHIENEGIHSMLRF